MMLEIVLKLFSECKWSEVRGAKTETEKAILFLIERALHMKLFVRSTVTDNKKGGGVAGGCSSFGCLSLGPWVLMKFNVGSFLTLDRTRFLRCQVFRVRNFPLPPLLIATTTTSPRSARATCERRGRGSCGCCQGAGQSG